MARLLQVKTPLLNSIKTLLLEGKSRVLIDFNSTFCLLGRLTIFGGHYQREVKMEVGYMCLFQRMTCVVARSMKTFREKKVVFFRIFEFMVVKMEVNDLKSQNVSS